MLRKVFRWMAIIFSSLLILIVLVYLFIYFQTQSRINKEYQVSLQTLLGLSWQQYEGRSGARA